MADLKDIDELFAPYIARLRDLGLTGEFRLWAHSGVDWTLLSKSLPNEHGNESFGTWKAVEDYVTKLVASTNVDVDPIALGM